MAKAFIFESPKREKRRSAPIPESNESSIKHLQSRGWKLVETTEQEPETEPVTLAEPLVEGNIDPFADYRDTLKDEQWDALAAAGYDTPAAVREASDEDLRNVEGVGPASVRNLRAAMSQPQTPPEA